MLLGGLLWGIRFPIPFALVIDEGILWVGARVEVGLVGLVGCVEGGSCGVEALGKLGAIWCRATPMTCRLFRCWA